MKKLLIGMGILLTLIVTITLNWQSNITAPEDVETLSSVEKNDVHKPLEIQASSYSDSSTLNNADKSKDIIKKEKTVLSEEVTVEQAFLVDGTGVSLDFIKNIDDTDIFSTAIDSLKEESKNNIMAQENKNHFEALALNLANKHLANNENYDFELNDIQCGEKTCLFSATSNGDGMWDLFQDDLMTADNGIYTAAHRSYVDDYGNIHHNTFISVDETVNSIVSTDPIGTISVSDGATINFGDPEDGGGG